MAEKHAVCVKRLNPSSFLMLYEYLAGTACTELFRFNSAILFVAIMLTTSDASSAAETNRGFDNYTLDFNTATDSALQARLVEADARLRERHGLATNDTAVGLLDLKRLRLALIHPDRI